MVVPFIFLVAAACICAIKAVRAVHLLHAALWLAGVSGIVTIMLYMIGAYTMAVIELSLSVGLITILLVFAISMIGADSPDIPASKWINWPVLMAMLLLIIGLTIPLLPPQTQMVELSFSATFWQQRQSDVVAQIALIFAGVLGVLSLLAETNKEKITPKQNENGINQQIDVSENQQEIEKV